jgi:hypothetical protein
MAFNCTICGEESTRICVFCTKDTCSNHLCDRCGSCSDCCACEVKLEERPTVQEAGYAHHSPNHHPTDEPYPGPDPLQHPEEI